MTNDELQNQIDFFKNCPKYFEYWKDVWQNRMNQLGNISVKPYSRSINVSSSNSYMNEIPK